VGLRAGLYGRKISPPPGFDPGPSNPKSVAIPTELPGLPIYFNKKAKRLLIFDKIIIIIIIIIIVMKQLKFLH